MNIKIEFYFLSLIFLFSCSENSTNPYNNHFPLGVNEAIKEIDMNIVDYDSIHIRSRESFVLSTKEIDSIFISYIDESDNYYDYNDIIIPNYEGKQGAYRIDIDKGINTWVGHIIDLNLAYHTSDGNILTIDSTFLMYKYPYNNTEIFFNLEENLSINTRFLQGFEINGNELYFCPSAGLAGIWRYNFITGKEEDLYVTGAGDHLAGNATYIFHDKYHYILVRYNINLDSVDVELDLSSYNYSVAGLAVSESNLYCLVSENHNHIFKLLKLDFSLNIIDEILIPQPCYYLTINDGMAYLKSYITNELYQYNLVTKEFTKSLTSPSYFGAMEGFRIYDNKFYYVNFGGPYMYVLDLSDLKPILTQVDNSSRVFGKN